MAQKGAPGIMARPSGYATNAKPGPATEISLTFGPKLPVESGGFYFI